MSGAAPEVRVSETIRTTFDNTGGVWDSGEHAIVVKRSLLSTPLDFAGTYLHEVAHAMTGAGDATRDFETVLTDYLGLTGTAALRSNSGLADQSPGRKGGEQDGPLAAVERRV